MPTDSEKIAIEVHYLAKDIVSSLTRVAESLDKLTIAVQNNAEEIEWSVSGLGGALDDLTESLKAKK